MLRSVLKLTLGARLPIVDGAIDAPLLREPITIRRDAWGVAYVEAPSDDGAFYGMGFCHAQDRGFHVDVYVRAARGRLSELAGAEMLDADRLARRIGFDRIARAQLAVCAPHVRAQMEAFARGVRD